MKKTILIVLLVLAGILLMAAGIFFIANWNDEPLLPEVQKSLNWQPPAHAFEDNGYLVLMGIGIPAEQDAAEAGRKFLENDIKNYLASKSSFNPSPRLGKPDNFPSQNLRAALCVYTETENCVEFYLRSLQQDKQKLSALLSSQKVLIDRLFAIQKSRNYVEVTIPSINFELPHYGRLVFASELTRLRAVEEIKEGNFENGITLFVENAQLSRRLLSNSTSLISHMIALAFVQHDMRILSELMARYPRIASFKDELRPVLMPISGDEYSMKNVFGPERDIALNYFNDMKESIGEDRSSMLPIKLNATQNLSYQIGTARMDVAGVNANRLDEALSVFEKKRKAMMGFSILNIYFYNPGGKILLDVGEPSYNGYVERQHDTDGYIRLVATQAKLISENVPADSIPETLKNLAPEFCNPYSGLPMEWDSEHRKLRFKGRQPSNHLPGRGNVYEAQFPAEAS